MYTPGDKEPSDPFWTYVKNLFQARAREKEARRRRKTNLLKIGSVVLLVLFYIFIATFYLIKEGKEVNPRGYIDFTVYFWEVLIINPWRELYAIWGSPRAILADFAFLLDHAVGAFALILLAAGIASALVRAFKRPAEEGYRSWFLTAWTALIVATFVAAGYALGDEATRVTAIIQYVPAAIAQVSHNEVVSATVRTAWRVVVALGELYGFIEFMGLARKAVAKFTGRGGNPDTGRSP
jgi:hypothetical protein